MQHQYSIRNGNRQSPARAAFPDDGGYHGNFQACHLVEVATNCFGLPALLGVDTGISARSVDERKYRHTKTLGQPHQPQRLAVALRSRHTEIAKDLLFCIVSFLVTDNDARLSAESSHPADDRMVIRKRAITVQFFKVREDMIDVIKRVGALRMPCDLSNLPRRQLSVDILGQGLALGLQPANFFGDVDSGIVLHKTQLFDLAFQFGDRLFKVQKGRFHGRVLYSHK